MFKKERKKNEKNTVNNDKYVSAGMWKQQRYSEWK